MASKTIPAKTVYICDCCAVETHSAQQVVLSVTEMGDIGSTPIPIWRLTKDLCWECYMAIVEPTAKRLSDL